jgi:hypothetical protein
MIGVDSDQSAVGDSRDRTTDAKRAEWRAPLITRFALERTLNTVGSSGDSLTNKDTHL